MADQQQIKRLKIAAWRRGIREMDLILGRYFDENAASMSAAALDEFASLMGRSDRELYDIIAGFKPLPDDDPHYGLLTRLQEFANAGPAKGSC